MNNTVDGVYKKQELLIPPEHLGEHPVFGRVRVADLCRFLCCVFCFVLFIFVLRLVSNVACVSALVILDCSIGFLWRLNLWWIMRRCHFRISWFTRSFSGSLCCSSFCSFVLLLCVYYFTKIRLIFVFVYLLRSGESICVCLTHYTLKWSWLIIYMKQYSLVSFWGSSATEKKIEFINENIFNCEINHTVIYICSYFMKY